MTLAEQTAFRVAIELIFYSGLAAPAVTALFWKWYKTRLGWSVASKTIALSLSILPAMLMYWFGPIDSDALTYFSLVMLFLVPAIIWWRVVEIYRVQRDKGEPV